MKRCNRWDQQQNQPYLEFNFEKSLRKYEKIPQKKIKLHSSSPQNILLLHRTSEMHSQSIKVEQPLNAFKDISDVDPIQQKPQQKQKHEMQQMRQLNEIQCLNEEPKDERFEPQVTYKNEEGQQKDEKEILGLLVIQKDQIQISQPQHIDKLNPKGYNSQQNMGGRFHLNSNVFISKRSILRLAKEKNQQSVVEELLKNRDYLENERQSIQLRLKQFLNQNQNL